MMRRIIIYLPRSQLAEVPTPYSHHAKQRIATATGRPPADSPVSATIEGGYTSPNAVSHAWIHQMGAFGMSSVTLHSLRHTHASMLIASGVDILTVSRRLGHSSPTVTLEVYGHLIHGGDDK